MKKTIVTTFIVLLVLSACTDVRYSMASYAADLTPFSEQGFLFTTTDIAEEYVSVAIVTTECRKGYVKVKKTDHETQEDNIYYNPYKSGGFAYCNIDDVLSQLHKVCVNAGANALIQLKITSIEGNITATGLAVKIKK